MRKYFAIVQRDSDTAFGVWFPDLPGCFGAGDTEDEALIAAKKSLLLYAEDVEDSGEKLPKARSLGELNRDPEVRASLKDSESFFVEVPLVRNTGRTKRVSLELDVALIDIIDTIREEAALTRKAWFEQVARDRIYAHYTGIENISSRVRFPKKRAVA